jgi:hypothetical protein
MVSHQLIPIKFPKWTQKHVMGISDISVGREVSAQPPWSIETSTMTAPGFIAATVREKRSLGAVAPATKAAAITTSADVQSASIVAWLAPGGHHAPPPGGVDKLRRNPA